MAYILDAVFPAVAMDTQLDAKRAQEYVLTANIILLVTTVSAAKTVTTGVPSMGPVRSVHVLIQTVLPLAVL